MANNVVKILDGPYQGYGLIVPEKYRQEAPRKGFVHVHVIANNQLKEILVDMYGYKGVFGGTHDYMASRPVIQPILQQYKLWEEEEQSRRQAEEESKAAEIDMTAHRHKIEYYLTLADVAAQQSPCLRRKYGAVLVKDNRVLAIGYNGPVDDEPHCRSCVRDAQNATHAGDDYQECPAIHAEWNVLMQVGYEQAQEATLYLVGYYKGKKLSREETYPCKICARMLRKAKVEVYGWENKR